MTFGTGIVKAWKRVKARYVGEHLWSGPGSVTAVAPAASTAIVDSSFHFAAGPDAVLLVHGLTGTPTEMRTIGRSLANAGFTVHGMQMAGHCGSEDDLLRTTWQDWYASVEAAYRRLAEKHENVFVAGLSMGAVMALHLAHQHRDGVKGVALYSTTLQYDGWAIPRLVFLLPLLLYSPFGDRYRFVETFPYGIKDERLRNRIVSSMLSGDSAAAGTLGMAGRSLRELRKLVGLVKREMPAITTPALILHAVEDDVTSVRNAEFVERHLAGPVRKVLLDDCYHIITADRQRHEVARETIQFFRDLSGAAALSNAAE